MNLKELLAMLCNAPEQIAFQSVIDTIDTHFDYQPTRFTNGNVVNEPGSNEGSCKIFAFAQLHDLNEAQTLSCFGKYYRDDVLKHPDGTDHANIRTFMLTGWQGIQFDAPALTPKTTHD